MKTVYSFLIVVLVATAVANATTKMGHSKGGMPASHQRKGRGVSGFWMPWMGRSRDEGVLNTRTNVGSAIREPQHAADKRQNKVCTKVGPCYGMRLVCPKKCRAIGGGIEKKHLPGQCIFDCNKCIAYC